MIITTNVYVILIMCNVANGVIMKNENVKMTNNNSNNNMKKTMVIMKKLLKIMTIIRKAEENVK
jgi:hypothetical protein